MVEKFEKFHSTKIDNMEGQILMLNEKMDSYKREMAHLTKINNNLRQQLCEGYLAKIKEQELALNDKFEISGFSGTVCIGEDNTIKPPQEIMKAFTLNSLKLDKPILISNASVSVIPSKLGNKENKGEVLYKLKGSLVNEADWGLIFSKISNLKLTNLFLDKVHTLEVKSILAEFIKKVYDETQNHRKASLKNLTLTMEDQSFDVYSVLKSRFMKTL